jgi:hypothetical protein
MEGPALRRGKPLSAPLSAMTGGGGQRRLTERLQRCNRGRTASQAELDRLSARFQGVGFCVFPVPVSVAGTSELPLSRACRAGDR